MCLPLKKDRHKESLDCVYQTLTSVELKPPGADRKGCYCRADAREGLLMHHSCRGNAIIARLLQRKCYYCYIVVREGLLMHHCCRGISIRAA